MPPLFPRISECYTYWQDGEWVEGFEEGGGGLPVREVVGRPAQQVGEFGESVGGGAVSEPRMGRLCAQCPQDASQADAFGGDANAEGGGTSGCVAVSSG